MLPCVPTPFDAWHTCCVAPFLIFEGDKQISKVEFAKGLGDCGIDTTPAEIDAVFERFDMDGGGGLRLNEFVKLMAASSSADY